VPFDTQDTQGVKITAALSQTKLIQGEHGLVYLDLTIATPAALLPAAGRRASDIVVVLDRSGSMAAGNRLPYAKEAIRSVIGRLQADDRFALITFDSSATLQTGFVQVTDAVRESLYRQVASIRPGASTNLSDGLLKARALLAESAAERSRRVLLLSDGEANMGIVDGRELGNLAASFGQYGAVLSTIGMGLGFNETLMSMLADYGMGNYAYLERLATLGDILQKDVQEAQQLFASASGLEMTLGEGITITDAGGYPIDQTASPGTARLLTGQLLAGTRKHFVVTLQVPVERTGVLQLGTVTLRYTTDLGEGRVVLPAEHLQVAILEPTRRTEATASIDQELYGQLWKTNNLGRMQKEFSHWLRLGDRQKAQETMEQYRQDLSKAEAAVGVPLSSPQVTDTLSVMERDLHDAFSGPAGAQAEKRNRAAKDHHQKALTGQRSY
jgi:Ca-activated chloride channel family protein